MKLFHYLPMLMLTTAVVTVASANADDRVYIGRDDTVAIGQSTPLMRLFQGNPYAPSDSQQHHTRTTRVVLTPDGGKGYALLQDPAANSTSLYSFTSQGMQLSPALVSGCSPTDLAVTADGQAVYALCGGGTQLFRIDTNSDVPSLSFVFRSKSATYSLGGVSVDGTHLLYVNVTTGLTQTTTVIDTVSNTVTATLTGATQLGKVSYCPAGISPSPLVDGVPITISNPITGVLESSYLVGHAPLGQTLSLDCTKAYAITSTGVNNQPHDTPGIVTITNTATGTVIANPTVGIDPIDLELSPDGKNIYVMNAGDPPYAAVKGSNATNFGDIGFISVATNTYSGPVLTGVGPQPITPASAAVPPAYRAYIPNVDGTLSVVDTVSHDILANISLPGGSSFTPGGLAIGHNRIYLGDVQHNSIVVIDRKTNLVVDTIPGSIPALGISFSIQGLVISPDDKTLYVITWGGVIWSLDTATDQYVKFADESLFHTNACNFGGAQTGALSAGGILVVSCPGSLFMNLVTTNPFQIVHQTINAPTVNNFVLSPDGSFLVTISNVTGLAEVIDTHNLQVVKTLTIGINPAAVVALPNGTAYIVNEAAGPSQTTSGSISVFSWQGPSTAVSTIPLPAGVVPTGIAASPDGARVFITVNDNHPPQPTGAVGTDAVLVLDPTTNQIVDKFLVGTQILDVNSIFTGYQDFIK